MITRENYESYYVDFLDGTLSPEAEAAFLLFLEENPDLQLEDDSLPNLNAADEEMDPLEKQLLKKTEDEALIISHQTIDYAMIAHVEKQLNPDEEKNLQLWLINHPEYTREQALYEKTIVTPNSLVFPKKDELYQKTRIVPLWLSTSAIAASIVTVIGISAFFSLNKVHVGSIEVPQISKRQLDKNDKEKPHDGKKSIDYTPIRTERTYSKNTPFENHPVKKEKEEIKDNAPNEKQENNTPNHITNERGTLLPKQPEIAEGITEKTNPVIQEEKPGNYVAWSSMSNPIEPITNSLSKKLNTTIDFRRQKETKGKESGFYLKIGKFEIINKKGADRD